MTATHGTLYTGPITISTTTDVRAVSVVAGGQSGVVSTESYIFPAAVIDQPAAPSGFPTVWGENTNGTPQPANYAMNTAITQNPLVLGRPAAGPALAAHGFDHDGHSQHVVRRSRARAQTPASTPMKTTSCRAMGCR